jgi:CMP-N-acetylneuraminic acid synthetase
MLLPLGDKLLFQYIFDTLVEVKKKYSNLDIYCYCSDESISKNLPNGINFLERDSSLDSNETLGIDIYKSFINKVDSDIYVICHATSPFITADSIIKGIDKVVNEGHDSSLAVSRIQTFCWYEDKPLNYDVTNVIKTQDIDPIYYETSAFYIFEKDILSKYNRRVGNNPFLVETNRIESIDIDEKEDYDLAYKIANTN